MVLVKDSNPQLAAAAPAIFAVSVLDQQTYCCDVGRGAGAGFGSGFRGSI